MAATKKTNPTAAVGRMGAKKGGFARTAKLTPAQRSESARKAVEKTGMKKKSNEFQVKEAAPAHPTTADTSDQAFLALLKRYKATNDPTEMDKLSEQIDKLYHDGRIQSSDLLELKQWMDSDGFLNLWCQTETGLSVSRPEHLPATAKMSQLFWSRV
jgi:hypothetical protein